MKSYTNLEQSKKLAEILPVKSADMVYIDAGYCSRVLPSNDIDANSYPTICPCWSLAALLSVFSSPRLELDEQEDGEWGWHVCHYTDDTRYDSYYRHEPIDACYILILKLHEQKLL